MCKDKVNVKLKPSKDIIRKKKLTKNERVKLIS